MFEKEAEAYATKHENTKYTTLEWWSKRDVFRKGAEFGYNMGYHDAEEHYTNVLRKANEWQYGTPDTGKDLLCQTAPDEFEVGYYHPEDERFYTMDGRAIDVIAWKKILPPEVKNA